MKLGSGTAATLGVVGFLSVVSWCALTRSATPPSDLSPVAAETEVAPAMRPNASGVRWIAAASGETPEYTQVSLEQDLALAAKTFGEDGQVLFAAGAGRPVVQVLRAAAAPAADPASRLAALFSPRGGRDATYRAPQLALHGPATAQTVSAAIAEATAEGASKGTHKRSDDLLVYLGGHGQQGATAAENSVGFWGLTQLTALDLATLLHGSKRRVQIVATTCFSGGLAELAFDQAHAEAGPNPDPVCGLFAAPFDLEASGCDPNPDRSAQEGFGLHFLHALRGQTREGAPIDSGDVDFDGDGTIGLREAHAYVRIHSAAPDVPTSTSERWLEAVAPGPGTARTDVDLPEEDAVIAALGRQLGLVDQLERARLHLIKIENEIEAKGEALARTQEAEELAFRRVAADVLSRWPVLDDPWHPEFGDQLSVHHDALTEYFAHSGTYLAYIEARDAVDQTSNALFDLRAKAAPYERLARALEYRQRARRLAVIGGDDWATFEELRACELAVAPHGSR